MAHTQASQLPIARWQGNVSCEVKAYEDVSVPAGTFKTFRIECADNWEAGEFISGVNHTTSRYSPEVTIAVKTVTKEDRRWNNEIVSYPFEIACDLKANTYAATHRNSSPFAP